ncbi:MAG: CopG family transcriptional regulator [Micromonosporaceae bacterium]
MRTTVSLDDDVLLAVKERARREKRSVGEVLSDLARQALTHQHTPSGGTSDLHGFEPFPHRGDAISNELIDRLREDEAV